MAHNIILSPKTFFSSVTPPSVQGFPSLQPCLPEGHQHSKTAWWGATLPYPTAQHYMAVSHIYNLKATAIDVIPKDATKLKLETLNVGRKQTVVTCVQVTYIVDPCIQVQQLLPEHSPSIPHVLQRNSLPSLMNWIYTLDGIISVLACISKRVNRFMAVSHG